MKNINYKKVKSKQSKRTVLFFLLMVISISQAYAQLAMKKHTINNGGGVMTGGGFELKSSIGQVDAGPTASEGHVNSNYSLSSGFWQQNTDLIFKDNLE